MFRRSSGIKGKLPHLSIPLSPVKPALPSVGNAETMGVGTASSLPPSFDLRPYIPVSPAKEAFGSAPTSSPFKPVQFEIPKPGYTSFGPMISPDIKAKPFKVDLLTIKPRWQRVLARFITTPLSKAFAVIVSPLRILVGSCMRAVRSKLNQPAENIATPLVPTTKQEISITIGENPIQLPEAEHAKRFHPNVRRDFRKIETQYEGFQFDLYISDSDYQKATSEEIREGVEVFVGAYKNAIRRFSELGAIIPTGTKFEMFFGETKQGLPYHLNGRVFPHIIKFGSRLSPRFQEILEHEIGHNLSFLVLKKALHDPTIMALEEGLAQYAAAAENLPVRLNKPGSYHQLLVTTEQPANIKGLTQLDVEISLGGTPSARKAGRLYKGKTTHLFGLEFIHAFIEIFSIKQLIPFLKRLKRMKKISGVMPDYGTEFIKVKLREMLAQDPDRERIIQAFEDRLHERLIVEQRVYSTEGGVPLS